MSKNHAVGFDYQNQNPGGAKSYILPALVELLLKKNISGRILDIGCGNGSVARKLEKHGFEVWGCEWDPQGVAIASQEKPDRFLCWDLNAPVTEFPWRGFSAIISSEVIEHLFLPRNLFRLAHHTLVPQGFLALTTPYHGYWKNLAISLVGKWDWHHNVQHDGGHIKFFSPKALQEMMKEEKFTPQGWKGCGRVPGLWKSMMMWGLKN